MKTISLASDVLHSVDQPVSEPWKPRSVFDVNRGKQSVTHSFDHTHTPGIIIHGTFDDIDDIFVKLNWVNTRWHLYSTHNRYIGQHK